MESCAKKNKFSICDNGVKLDEQVIKYKKNGNKEFGPIWRYYRKFRAYWYRWTRRRIKIERDVFDSGFAISLWKSLEQFNFEDAFKIAKDKEIDSDNIFNRYFFSATQRFCVDLIRSDRRKKSEREIEDKYTYIEKTGFETEDLLDQLIKDTIDNHIVRMIVSGNSAREICDELKISHYIFKSRLERLSQNKNFEYLLGCR